MPNRWPINREWEFFKKSVYTRATTDELSSYRACGLLGSAGLGKSYELTAMNDAARANQNDVRFKRLATMGQTPSGLESQLNSIVQNANAETVLFLDALDEVMVPVQTTALIIEHWIRNSLPAVRPKVRISCRSAVWPSAISAALEDVYGSDDSVTAQLQPLSEDDVAAIANASNLDAHAFWLAIENANAQSLSQQPLTLEMLLKVYGDSMTLPQTRSHLFREGIYKLADERMERRAVGTAAESSTAHVLAAAEYLACITLLSGRAVVDLGDHPMGSDLGRQLLEQLPTEPPLTFELLRDLGRCGICESDEPLHFRFAHRQFSEYLAGRRLARLLPHQAKSLLSSGLGWRSGVAGPLRETAAFAAMESTEIATWVSEYDPEVIGLSDVVDDDLRRRATQNLLDKFRRHELTDLQAGNDVTELIGFKYANAASDLRIVLLERQEGCEDVLECAIKLIESWNLVEMSDELATLTLDPTLPFQVRKTAGYTLQKIGSSAARRRLLPLLAATPEDSDLDLKGQALFCLWPEHLTLSELLDVLGPATIDNYHGMYDEFIRQLNDGGFDAREEPIKGLQWAQQFVDRDIHFNSAGRIANRIAVASIEVIDRPGVADALADLVIKAAAAHADPPLRHVRESSSSDDDQNEIAAPLFTNESARRMLIVALAPKINDESDSWSVGPSTPGLLNNEDFRWLLQMATDDNLPMQIRTRYAEFARMLNWRDEVANVDAWLAVRQVEPIATEFGTAISVELASEEASNARKQFARARKLDRKPKLKKLHPPPAERIEQALVSSETKDARFFLNLCKELTVEEYSTRYKYERFLSRTPGWIAATEATRTRIIDAAKRYVLADSEEPSRSRTVSLSSILFGPMEAMWLLLERDREWLASLPNEWWSQWTWYILRESHPNMSDEPREAKEDLLRLLFSKSPESVCAEISQLARRADEQSSSLLSTLLGEYLDVEDDALDTALRTALVANEIATITVRPTAQFLLSRCKSTALANCLELISPSHEIDDDATLGLIEALLQERPSESWPILHDYLRSRPDHAAVALKRFARGRRTLRSEAGEPVGLAAMTFTQLGEIASLLLENSRRDGHDAGVVVNRELQSSDWDERLLNELINWLARQQDYEAVEALRSIEKRFSAKCPWLRRPRAEAERAYRLSIWSPVAPNVVGDILAANAKRLIRSEGDIADGVVDAVGRYENDLRHSSPSNLEDLWNNPSNQHPTPKTEERVSEKLCAAIRSYFRDYALTADREVQVYKRKSSRATSGAPGSEVDVLCSVPAIGASSADAIVMPIEVKLAHNPEARTGLRLQLVDRYMNELGSNCGAFVVVWMGDFDSPRNNSTWESVQAAQKELDAQARELMSENKDLDLRVVVVDASLPLAKRSSIARPSRKKKSKSPKKPTKKLDRKRPAKKTTRKTKSQARPKAVKKKKRRER